MFRKGDIEEQEVRLSTMASGQDRSDLNARARHGRTVIPGGTASSHEAQEHLAQVSLSLSLSLSRVRELLVDLVK